MAERTQDGIIQRALSRRRELEEEIRKLDTFLYVYEQLGGQGAMIADASVILATDTNHPTTTEPKEPTPPGRKASGMSQADFTKFVRQLLLEIQRPLQPEEILEQIHNKGRHVGGTKEWDNFKTKLWRAKSAGDITQISGAGYWPADVACEAVGYVPTVGLLGETLTG